MTGSCANTAVELAPSHRGKPVQIAYMGNSEWIAGSAQLIEYIRSAGNCRWEGKGRGVVM